MRRSVRSVKWPLWTGLVMALGLLGCVGNAGFAHADTGVTSTHWWQTGSVVSTGTGATVSLSQNNGGLIAGLPHAAYDGNATTRHIGVRSFTGTMSGSIPKDKVCYAGWVLSFKGLWKLTEENTVSGVYARVGEPHTTGMAGVQPIVPMDSAVETYAMPKDWFENARFIGDGPASYIGDGYFSNWQDITVSGTIAIRTTQQSTTSVALGFYPYWADIDAQGPILSSTESFSLTPFFCGNDERVLEQKANNAIVDEKQQAEDALDDQAAAPSDGSDTGLGNSTQSLVSAAGSMIGAFSNTGGTSCAIPMNLPNLPLGSLDLCRLQVPPIVQTVVGLFLFVLSLPAILALWRRLQATVESIQGRA